MKSSTSRAIVNRLRYGILAQVTRFFFTLAPKSCKDIRDKGVCNEDGEYWIDPTNDGRQLKVFCDMTTDGGRTIQKKICIFPDFRHS